MTLQHARTDHNTAHSTPLHCKTPTMRQNTTSQSTQHAARGPAGPIVRPAATRLRAPSPRAHSRACAPVRRSYSTKKAPAIVRSGPPRAHSTHCTRSHATCRSPRTSRHALPSLPSAQHAHSPARARASRARTAQPSLRQKRQLPPAEEHVAFTSRSDFRMGVNVRNACICVHASFLAKREGLGLIRRASL